MGGATEASERSWWARHSCLATLRLRRPLTGKSAGPTGLANRRARRLSLVAIFLAVGLNALLFLALSWMNRVSDGAPDPGEWTVVEVFRAELPPEQAPPPEELAAPQPQPRQDDENPLELQPRRELFQPRLGDWIAETSLEQPALSLEALWVAEAGVRDSFGAAPLELAQVDRAPRKTYGPLPSYPFRARVQGIEGSAMLRFVVGRDGRVRDIEVKSVEGDERFADAARRAVAQWHFEPAVFNGKAAAVWCVQTIQFKLSE